MNSMMVLLGAGAVGFLIGRSLEAAHDAHHRFTAYRGRTFQNLDAWIRGIAKTVLEFAAVGAGIYLLLTLHIL